MRRQRGWGMMAMLLAAVSLGCVGRRVDGALAPAAGGIEGTWYGTLEAGPQKIDMIFTVTRQPDGTLKSTLSVPQQGVKDMPFDATSFADGTLKVTLPGLNASFEGTLSADGKTIDGMWMQNGANLPLEMGREQTTAALNRPQEPKPPFPYAIEQVTFENAAAGITFSGTLTLPPGGPHPAVVLISGSGAQDRDETIAGHKPFWVLADHLSRHGFVVLRYDDRGVNGTGGSVAQSSSEDFAGDVTAAVAMLARRPEVEPTKIGLIGHSEGGLVAPLAADASPDVAFAVLLASPGVSGRAIVEQQATQALTAAGADAEVIARQQALTGALFDIILEEADPAKARERCLPLMNEEARRQGLDPDDAAIKQLIASQLDELVNPWMRFFVSYDPTEILPGLRQPVLALWGEKDWQVPPDQNMDPIERALKEADVAGTECDLLPGLNHLLQTANSGAPDEYATIEETIAPIALDRITEWLKQITD